MPAERYLIEKEIEQIVRANEQPPFAYRNRGLIYSATYLFLRAFELTLIELGDVMAPNGDIYPEFTLPEHVAIDGKPRLVVIPPHVASVLKRMIQWWVDNRLNESGKTPYMGRDPKARLFINDKWMPYELTRRKANEPAIHPTSMNRKLNQFISNAGFKGTTVKSFRESGIRITNSNSSMTDIQIMKMAGISSLEILYKILKESEQDLEPKLNKVFRSC